MIDMVVHGEGDHEEEAVAEAHLEYIGDITLYQTQVIVPGYNTDCSHLVPWTPQCDCEGYGYG